MGQLFKNVASQKVRVFAFADAGHATLDPGEPVTGDAAQITAYTAADNAALGASNDVNPAEVDSTNAPGVYEFDATQGETNGSVVEWYPKSSTAGVQVVTIGGNVQQTLPQYLPVFNIASDGDIGGNVDGNVVGSVASVTGAVGSVTGAVGSVTGNVGGNVTGSVGSLATQAKADVNAEADTALSDWGKTGFSLAATGLDAIASTATGMVEIAKAIWDRVISGANHNVGGSAGKRLREASEAITGTTGTAQAGASTTITLESGQSAVDDIYNGERIIIIEGTGAGQARLISDYVGSTKVATVHRAWTTTPDNTSVYAIQGADVDVVYIEGVDATDQINAAADTAISDAALATAANLATVDTNVNAILVDTGTTLPGVLGTPAGADLATDIAAVKTDTAATLVDTGTTLPATLTTIEGKIDTVDTVADTILVDTNELQTDWADGGRLDLLLDSVISAITGTLAEASSIPAANASMQAKINAIFTEWRNKNTQTATTKTVFADDGTTPVWTSTVSDDGTTFTKGELT